MTAATQAPSGGRIENGLLVDAAQALIDDVDFVDDTDPTWRGLVASAVDEA